MANVRWTVVGLNDFEEISDSFTRVSPILGLRFSEKIAVAMAQLRDFPHSGRVTRSVQDLDVREISIRPYRLFYRVIGGSNVEPLRLLDGRRNVTRLIRETLE